MSDILFGMSCETPCTDVDQQLVSGGCCVTANTPGRAAPLIQQVNFHTNKTYAVRLSIAQQYLESGKGSTRTRLIKRCFASVGMRHNIQKQNLLPYITSDALNFFVLPLLHIINEIIEKKIKNSIQFSY